MLYKAYRFATREALDAVRADAPILAELDEIGAAFADGEGEAPGAALPGWHVNAIWPEAEPPSWAGARIPAEDAPRWWAGVPRVVLPVVPALGEYEAAIQAHIDTTAGERGYSSGVSCASFVASTILAWAAEAAAFVAWRDQVWIAAYALLAAVQSGAPAPTVRGLVAALPAMEWLA